MHIEQKKPTVIGYFRRDLKIRYIKFHGAKKHPRNMGKSEIETFLSYLAVQGDVSASTQRQALNAIIFLYRDVLDIHIEEEIEPVKARRHRRLPVVMTQSEVKQVLNQTQGTHLLMAHLLYGSGLRLMECIRLRVKDLDFEGSKIYIRAGKCGKDRITVFPKSIKQDLHIHLSCAKELHNQDLLQGFGESYFPNALAIKYPNASKEFRWSRLFGIFPSRKLSKDPRSGIIRRHHVLESGLQKAVLQTQKSCNSSRGSLQRCVDSLAVKFI